MRFFWNFTTSEAVLVGITDVVYYFSGCMVWGVVLRFKNTIATVLVIKYH